MIKKIEKYNLSSLWAYSFIALVLFLFYLKIFLVQGAWLVGDHAEQHFPWAEFLAHSLKSGLLPFWTGMIQSGFPITAEGQIGTFYLPNILFYFFLPVRAGYAWNIVFHLVLSAFFMMAYFRSLGIGNRGALFGTLVYLFGSTLGGAYYNITSLKVLTWFPLTLVITDKILGQIKFRWLLALGMGFLFSLEILAGYLQFAVYAMLFTGLYFLFRWFETPQRNFRSFFRAFLHFFVAGLFGALIAFPQLLMTFELAMRSNRAVAQEGFAYVGSYSPLAVICLVFPSLEGFFVSKLYLGILPIFLIIVALFSFKSCQRKSIYFLAGLAFLLALGQFSPLYILIVKLFHFHSFRTPVKFIYFAGFFLCVLSAWGMQWTLQNMNSPRILRSAKAYCLFLVAMLVAVVGAYVAFNLCDQPLSQLGTWLLRKFVHGTAGHPYAWGHYEIKLANLMQSAKEVLNPRGEVIFLPWMKMIAACLILWAVTSKKISKGVFYGLVLMGLIVDLNLSYSDIRGDYADYEIFLQKNAVTGYLEEHSAGSRYFNYSENLSDVPLPVSKNMIYRIKSANAYSPLVSRDYYDFMSHFGGINDSVACQSIDDDYFLRRLKLLGMLNVKYVVSDRLLESSDLPKVFSEGKWGIYENRLVMDQANLVARYEVEPARKAIFDKTHDENFEPRKLVYLEEPPVFRGKINRQIISNSLRVIENRDGYLLLEVDSSIAQILLISETYFPGWVAAVDGKPVQIYRANYILMGIPVTQGRHHILLRYAPFSHFLPSRKV